MLNHQGYVTEATVDNVFIVHKGTLYTPTVTIGVLPGITRAVVIELATKYLELPVKEALLTRYDLYNAEEVFLTGTAVEIVPVVKIDGRIIGDGKPGKITKELRRIFYEYTRQENVGSPVYVNE